MSKGDRSTLTPRRVLALFRRDAALHVPLKTVLTLLGAKRADQSHLKMVLEGLVRDGSLSFEKHRYRLAERSTPPPPRRAPELPPKGEMALEGRFTATGAGYGFVATDKLAEDLFVPPPHIGAALDGDTVRVSLRRGRRDPRPHAVVEEVLERGRTLVRGIIRRDRREVWLEPYNTRYPLVFVETEEPPERGTHAEVRIVDYPRHAHEAPVGQLVMLIEAPEEPEQIIDNLIAEAQLPVDFPDAVHREMARLPAEVADGDPQQPRRDQRDLPYVTIDGEDARDFDDAVCLREEPGGGLRLWVAIADVADYVRPGMAVDASAWERGTSVYFPNRVIPMLPEALSNGLCSLQEDKPRLTLTCEMLLNAQGAVADYEIYPGLIRSRARLTYTQVQALLDGDGQAVKDKTLRPMLRQMAALATVLRNKREARGALHLILPEAKLELDAHGLPTALHKRYPTAATGLIEQFMLEANETVARHCAENGIPILFRVHDPPPVDQSTQLETLLGRQGVALPKDLFTTPGQLNTVLRQVENHPLRDQIELALLKTLSQARYRETNDGHFGLAATHYAHFTSPIRRYPDLLLHRALKQQWATGRRPPPVPNGAGLHLSTRERVADACSSQVDRLYRVLYMERFLGQSFAATVSAVSEKGLWVGLREEFVEGSLPMERLHGSRYRLDRQRGVLTGRGKQREMDPERG